MIPALQLNRKEFADESKRSKQAMAPGFLKRKDPLMCEALKININAYNENLLLFIKYITHDSQRQ